MAILKIRDADGAVQEIIAIKGDKGDKGDSGEFTGGELLKSHINNENNPHSTTAEQVGARPVTWTPTATDIGAAPAVESEDYPDCYYRTVNGETEWINPPMIQGVEYRTTERYHGNVVYTILVNLGAVVLGETNVQWYNDSTVGPIRHTERFYGQTLPFYSSNGAITLIVRLAANNARIYCASNWVDESTDGIMMQVWYIK